MRKIWKHVKIEKNHIQFKQETCCGQAADVQWLFSIKQGSQKI